MNALRLLKNDHSAVEGLFKQFEKSGPRAYKTQEGLVAEMIKELSIHAAIEEQVFYPTVRTSVPATLNSVLEDLEEHHIVKWMLSELEGMSADDERFVAKVTVLMENVRHHVKEEENELFVLVDKGLGPERLDQLGDELSAAKAVVPQRPHPRSPDTPSANILAGVAAAGFDKIKSLAQDVAGRANAGSSRR